MAEPPRAASASKEPRMWRSDPEPRWQDLAEEAFVGMKRWRAEPPRATWAEIEAALDERLAVLRGRMLEDAAQASAATDFRGASAADRPRCPDCGEPLLAVGQEARPQQPGQVAPGPRPHLRPPEAGGDAFLHGGQPVLPRPDLGDLRLLLRRRCHRAPPPGGGGVYRFQVPL